MPHAKIDSAPAAESLPQRPRMAGAYLVAVDDEVPLATMNSMLLAPDCQGASGIDVSTQTLAELTDEIVAEFRKSGAPRPLMLLDRDLGNGRFGEELAAAVIAQVPHATCVIYTAKVKEHTHLAELAHVHGTLQKPANRDQIMAALEAALERREVGAAR